MDSKRTKAFKKLFGKLPGHIKVNAKKQYKLFLENPSHPSLRNPKNPVNPACGSEADIPLSGPREM